MRDFVEKELRPNTDEWIRNGYPKDTSTHYTSIAVPDSPLIKPMTLQSLHKLAYERGIQGSLFPSEFGGFHALLPKYRRHHCITRRGIAAHNDCNTCLQERHCNASDPKSRLMRSTRTLCLVALLSTRLALTSL